MFYNVESVSRYEQLGYLLSKCFGHVFTANVGNALESKRYVNRVPGGEIILDALNDELNEFRVARDEDRDEEVSNLFLCVLV